MTSGKLEKNCCWPLNLYNRGELHPIDTKATLKIGPFSRGGLDRQGQMAADRDFEPEDTIKLFGIYIPETGENFFYFTNGNVTPDFMVDALQNLWPYLKRRYNPHAIVINADNGPENGSGRTQYVKRIVEFAARQRIDISLDYYQPYHSKYNPVERVCGVLENYWKGQLLDSVEKAIGLAKKMKWNGKKPIVKIVDKIYETGIRLSKNAMKKYEVMLKRLPGLQKWFVDIFCFEQ